ncbi:MAG TPA: SAM-dependent methyltransferase [Candidatus Limnocylindria bacterium]|nr:SAM-dependent methyltransferase [Candidatus Limnocylindria bacterium]
MPEQLSDALADVRAILLDPDRLVRAVAAGRRRGLPAPEPARAVLRPVDLKGGRRLLVEAWDGTQTTTRHADFGAGAETEVDVLLAEPYGNWHVETVDATVQVRVTKKGEAQVHRAATDRSQQTDHDRKRRRVLADDDPLFAALGAGADKRRQVEAFLRLLDPVLPAATGRPTGVVDLGCGNAVLTFAAFRHLTADLGHEVRVVGVDVKAQARSHNEEVAATLGCAEQVSFVESSIVDAEVDLGEARLDVVLALHACDTATDDALARAVRWEAPVLLAAPCCHHDLQRQLSAASPPKPYALLARDGILRERFADVLTDALRAELLRLLGYRVDVLEFVASQHTPRNTMIRAVRTGASPDAARARDYRALIDQWQVRPRLHVLLAEELAPVLGVR